MRFSAGITSITVAALIALSGCQGSIFSAAVHSGKKLPNHGYEADGEIHPHNEDDWCLTAPTELQVNNPVYVEPCNKQDARQIWHIAYISSVGQIQLTTTALSVGQSGTLNTARLVDNTGNKATRANYFITFTQRQTWWLLSLPAFRAGVFLTAPVNLNMRTGIYPLIWQATKAPSQANQYWDLPKFRKVN